MLSGAIKTIEIVEGLMKIWINEVCDKITSRSCGDSI